MRLLMLTIGAALAAAWWISRRDDSRARAAEDPAPGVLALVAGQARELLDNFGGSVSALWELPAAGEPYRERIAAAELRYGLPQDLLARLLWQESRFRPEIINGAIASSAGALGIAQFMPATAAELGIDPLDPNQAIPAAAKMLRRLYDQAGDWTTALAAYNWGEGNVRRNGLSRLPAESINYASAIVADVNVFG